MLSLNFDWTRFIEVDTQPYAVEYLPMEVRLFPDWKKSVHIEWDVPPDDLGQVPTFKVYSSMSELAPSEQSQDLLLQILSIQPRGWIQTATQQTSIIL